MPIASIFALLLGVSVCLEVPGATLRSGSFLTQGVSMFSPNGKYELAYQADDNLVLYDYTSKRVLWSTGTKAPTSKVAMQADGNLVVVRADGSPAWESKTAGNAGAILSLQDDGNLVIYRPNSCSALWSRR